MTLKVSHQFENIIVRKWADQAVICLVKHVHMKYNNTNTLLTLNIQKYFSPKVYTYIKQRYQGNNLPEAIGGIEFSSNVNYEMSPCHHRCMALALHRCRQGVNLPTDIGQIYK